MLISPTVARWLEPLANHVTYTIRHGLAKGLKRRGGLGFLAPFSSTLSREEAFLAKLSLTGGCVYDVGGYEGLYTLFFARAVGPTGQVICFEPIPTSQHRIRTNADLNGFQATIALERVALGAQAGQLTFMLPTTGARGQASGLPAIQAAYAMQGPTTSVRVPVRPLDAYLGQLRPPTFLKIDVEGMELEVIQGARETLRRHHPAVFIEMHGATREAALTTMRAILRELHVLDYAVIHAEHGTPLTPDSTPLPGSLHLYATPVQHSA
jgi:FkbM family methyltransferase